MTPCEKVYSAFLSKILEDDWETWTQEEVEEDLHDILLGALPRFKFPANSIELDETGKNFIGDLTATEIQIIATYMKCEWLNRNIMTWENIKPLYDERDWSQANLLDKFRQTLALEQKNAKELEAAYYRSRDKKPFKFGKLAG
jgi:hypothetical protein